MVVSIDRSTAVDQGGVITLWVKYAYAEGKGAYISGKGRVATSLSREEVSCRLMQTAVLSHTSYDQEGSTVYSVNYPYPMPSPIIPESMGELVWRAVCL